MPLTAEQAYDVITNHIITQWPIVAVSVLDPVPEMRFEGIEKTEIPKAPFARTSIRPVLEGQATLRDGSCGQRYSAEGLVFIQVFVPRNSSAREVEYCRRLANAAKVMLRDAGDLNGLWFLNCRATPLTPENKYHRWNAIAEYRYDEITT